MRNYIIYWPRSAIWNNMILHKVDYYVKYGSYWLNGVVSGCVAAVGLVSKSYVGGNVSGTTISPFMTSQQFNILAALCTCANYVPQLEPSSVSIFSFERSMVRFLALGGSFALKKIFFGMSRVGLFVERKTLWWWELFVWEAVTHMEVRMYLLIWFLFWMLRSFCMETYNPREDAKTHIYYIFISDFYDK